MVQGFIQSWDQASQGRDKTGLCASGESIQARTDVPDQEMEGATMQKHIERLVHRNETQRADDEKQEVWPLTAREFMKLPAAGLLSADKRLTSLVKREA